jgi:hypothetical protein
MLVLAPLEILLILGLVFLIFWLFRKALNSKKVDEVIDEVAHPEIHTVDAAIDDLDRAKNLANVTIHETDDEIKRKQAKNDRLRKAYGG